MRAVFYRLLAVLFDVQSVQWLLVGDPVQMLYDYDADDPAVLDYMRRPEEHFRRSSEWARTRLSVSFRLTPPLAALANELLLHGEPLVAGNTAATRPPPRVLTCSNWDWSRVVLPLVREFTSRMALHEITLLVRSVRSDANRPLAALP